MNYFKEMLRRMGGAKGWIGAQFWATLLIVLAGVGWTRLPDRHAWQVGLSILLPLVLLAALLLLQAGTMRKLAGSDSESARPQVRLAWGTLTLLVWVLLVWLAWLLLDWCDDRVFLWAAYLNSQAPRHVRVTLFSYPHLINWISLVLWIVRWIVLPAKLIPLAMASAQWGWRLPCGRLVRALLNWRWWLAVLAAALAGVALPAHLFAGLPHGSLAHQVWVVVLKVAGAYFLAIVCWVLLLGWAATLLARQAEPAEHALDTQLLDRLYAGRLWIAGLAIWTLFSFLSDVVTDHLPGSLKASGWIAVPLLVVLLVSLVFLEVALMRSMIGPDEKQASVVAGTLMPLVWTLPGVAALIVIAAPAVSDSLRLLYWAAIFGVLIPFFAASAEWGARLPWRRVLRVPADWRWWLGVVAAVVVGAAIPNLFVPDAGSGIDPRQTEIYWLRKAFSDVVTLASWIFLMGWYAVLLGRTKPGESGPDDDEFVLAPVHSGPLRKDSVRLPLPGSGGDSGGKA